MVDQKLKIDAEWIKRANDAYDKATTMSAEQIVRILIHSQSNPTDDIINAMLEGKTEQMRKFADDNNLPIIEIKSKK